MMMADSFMLKKQITTDKIDHLLKSLNSIKLRHASVLWWT